MRLTFKNSLSLSIPAMALTMSATNNATIQNPKPNVVMLNKN